MNHTDTNHQTAITRQGQRSSALVATMLMVSLLAVLMVGFVGSMRWEIFSARTHLGGVRASFFAQAGVDLALTRMTNELSDTTRFWASQPGRIMMSPKGAVQPVNVYVDLSSGATPVSATADQAADLNIRQQEDASRYLLAPDNLPLKVKWIYVRKDGTYDTAVPSSAPGANPVVGRFAFWVDDESCKVNINTAWTRDSSVNSKPVGHASRISLSEVTPLTAVDASQISAMRTASHFFNSPTEIALAGGNAVYLARTNAFSVTHYSHTPELNIFGEQRTLLTTQKSVADAAGSADFLDILTIANSDPGLVRNPNGSYNVDPTKMNALVARLYTKMTRTDWPMMPGQSIARKYAPVGKPERVIQLILNIIDYVRSVESSLAIVEPTRGKWNGSAFVLDTVPASDSVGAGTFMGCTRRLYIVEVGAFVPATPTRVLGTPPGENKIYNITYFYKLYYPPLTTGVPSTSVDLRSLYMGVAHQNGANSATYYTSGHDDPVTLSSIVSGNPVYPGNSAVIKTDFELSWCNVRPTVISMVPFISSPPWVGSQIGKRLERIPLSGPITQVLNYNVDTTSVPITHISSLIVKDPFVNKVQKDWIQSGAVNTFSTTPVYGGGTPTASADVQQDTDSSGNLTAASLRVPPPKGTDGNMRGRVFSIGELGYVHTGVECSSDIVQQGVPFRTIRLQPRAKNASTLPDWALLDLFCAPPLPIDAVDSIAIHPLDKPYQRPNNFAGGKININGMILPFTKADGKTPQISRLQPVTALLSGTTTFSSTVSRAQAAVLSSNIVNRVLATGNLTTGVEYSTNVYFAPGQMAEMKGVADGGEQSERLVSDAMALATTRGGVFSVYSVGQALLQDKTGKISVQGERRYQVMVERLTSGSTVKFVPVYSRDMKP